MKKKLNKESLEKQFLEKKKSTRQLAQEFGVSKNTIIRRCREWDLYKDADQIKDTTRQTNLKKYGKENVAKVDAIKARIRQTCLQRYGCGTILGCEAIQERIKKTCLERYGYENPAKNKDVRSKISESNIKAFSTGEPQEKCYNTKKHNHTLFSNTSKQEDQAYELLLKKFYAKDIVRQYKSTEYPFSCDFYIKPLNLYIECQFSHYHNNKPYDPMNPTHQKLVEIYKQKSGGIADSQWTRMITVWTEKDPLKRETAKANKLNWKEFFTIEELEGYLQSLNNYKGNN